MRLITWNMHDKTTAWARLGEMTADHHTEVALVQEAPPPPPRTRCIPTIEDREWAITTPRAPGRTWRSAVVMCDALASTARSIALPSMAATDDGWPSVSHPGQLAAAEVAFDDSQLLVVSFYGIWEWMRPDALSVDDRYAVPSVHRAISDLTRLWFENDRPIVIAGDFNIWRAEGRWRDRYQTVFDRMEAKDSDFRDPSPRMGTPPLRRFVHTAEGRDTKPTSSSRVT
jgi:hypothetical protein